MQNIDPGVIGKWRSGGEEADAVVSESAIGAGDRRHRLGLIDRAK